jgi:putative tryptophan/tyrosine transport system substrate-binding protein
VTEAACVRGGLAEAQGDRFRTPRARAGAAARRWLRASAVALFACAVSAGAQGPAARVYRVAWLSNSTPEADRAFIDATRQALRDLGYSEGRNLVLEFRHSDGQSARLPALAAELVALKPDLIVGGASPGTQAARQATSTIPIVMIGVADPVGAGFVESLAHPGRNVTGIANMGVDTAAKPIELLREVLPKAQRLFLLTSDNPGALAVAREALSVTRAQGLTLRTVSVAAADELPSAIATMKAAGAQGVVVIADTLLITQSRTTSRLLLDAGLPSAATYSALVEDGVLMSIGPNPRNLHRSVARYVDSILKGRRPADLAVEQPTEFEVAVNLRTAAKLGVTIPAAVRVRADRLID